MEKDLICYQVFCFITSESQLRNHIVTGFSSKVINTNLNVNTNWSEKKMRVLVSLSQKFFTMAYDDPAGAMGVFTDDIMERDLKNYVGEGNPLCYISSVTYGRLYSFVYETSASYNALNAALNFKYKGITTKGYVENKTDAEKIFSNTKVYITQIGGDPEKGLSNAMVLDIDKMRAFLEDGANFNPNNLLYRKSIYLYLILRNPCLEEFFRI